VLSKLQPDLIIVMYSVRCVVTQRCLCRMSLSSKFCASGSSKEMNLGMFLSVSPQIKSPFRMQISRFNIVKPEISRDLSGRHS